MNRNDGYDCFGNAAVGGEKSLGSVWPVEAVGAFQTSQTLFDFHSGSFSDNFRSTEHRKVVMFHSPDGAGEACLKRMFCMSRPAAEVSGSAAAV